LLMVSVLNSKCFGLPVCALGVVGGGG